MIGYFASKSETFKRLVRPAQRNNPFAPTKGDSERMLMFVGLISALLDLKENIDVRGEWPIQSVEEIGIQEPIAFCQCISCQSSSARVS